MSEGVIGQEAEKKADPFEVPVRETGAMEVFQTLGCPVQLF